MRKPFFAIAALSLSALALGACDMRARNNPPPPAAAAPAPMTFEYAGTADIRDGRYYTTRAGLTLYTYERDTDASVCYGACARQWRPYYVEGAAMGNADWTVHTRRDGRKQWSYRGKPVYTWHRDRNRGDLTGADRPGWSAVRLPPR